MKSIFVIIPMYNSAGTIERALDSVLRQTYRADYRIIIINDGSTDNSVEVVNRYRDSHPQAHITLIDKQNGGVSSARNAGLRAADGEWIALLDSDDEWLPHKMEVQMSILVRHPEIDLLGSNITGAQTRILWKVKKKLCPIEIWELFIKWHPPTSTVMFKASVPEDVGLYNEAMRYAEDGDFLLRVCMRKNAWFTPEQLVFYGDGKPAFGASGLSANLHGMQRGQRRILRYACHEHAINLFQYLLFSLYTELKHWRRLLIVGNRKLRNR